MFTFWTGCLIFSGLFEFNRKRKAYGFNDTKRSTKLFNNRDYDVLSILLKRGSNGSKNQAQVYLSAGSTDYKKLNCWVTVSRELILRIIRIYYENFHHYNIYIWLYFVKVEKYNISNQTRYVQNIILFCLICALSNTKFIHSSSQK